jgi:hypothetical protein
LKDNSICTSDDCRTITIDTASSGPKTAFIKINTQKVTDLSALTFSSLLLTIDVVEGDFEINVVPPVDP